MANLALAAHGDEAAIELRLYLESFLASARAEIRAGFSSEAGVALRFTDVAIPHDATPRRFRDAPRVSIAALTAPGRRGHWVIILPLAHTFWVDRGDDLDDAIRRETVRVAAAKDDQPWDYLRLLPPGDTELTRLVVSLGEGGAAAAETARKKHVHLEKATAKKNALAVLGSIASPWHEERTETKHPPIVGRERELQSLRALLEADTRTSVLLVGDELSGKSALLGAWFDDAFRRDAARPVYRTSVARLLAGMSGLGQWQARLGRVLEAIETLDAILYFENIGELFGDRGAGGIDLPGVIRAFIDEGRVRLVGEVDTRALDVLAPQSAGFFSALSRVRVPALDAAASAAALVAHRAHHLSTEEHRPRLTPGALATIVALTDRYLPYLPHPGKAVRLYDEVRAAHDKDPSLVGMAAEVDVADVERHFGVQTGIPQMLLGEGEALDLGEVEARLRRRVVGQDGAVETLVQTVAVMKATLSPADKPLGVFLFVGPTGVGKTELARALAELIFGSESRLSRFDMSEYADPGAVMRLIRGNDRRDGLLTRVIRQQPFGIVLLDEIEKAHPAVYDLLLGALGEARLSDARGRTAYLHNTIVIMTSNVGARASKRRIGIGAGAGSDLERYIDAARAHFRPEFLNRLDRIIPFHSLSAGEIRSIARMQVRALSRRRGLTELAAVLDVPDPVLDALAARGYSEDYGARALRRTLEDELVVPVAELLSREAGDAQGSRIRASLDDEGALRLDLTRGDGAGTDASGQASFHRIAAHRRTVDAWYHLPPVIQLREQVEFLVAQLNDLARTAGPRARPKAKKRAAILIPKLRAQHNLLDDLASRLRQHRADLSAIEELAFAAHLAGRDDAGGESDREQLEEASLAVDEFRASLPYALLALQEDRDAATFIVQQPDAQGGLRRWLGPLVGAAKVRGYHLTVHVPMAVHQPGAASWPAGRFWGPPQSGAWAKGLLEDAGSPLRAALITVKGPFAGALLALECGIHRWVVSATDRTKTAHLSVVLASMRSDVTDRDHASKLFRPVDLPSRAQLLRTPAMRDHDLPGGRLTILDGDVTLPLPDDYWASFEDTATEHLVALAASGRAIADVIAIRQEGQEAPDDDEEDRSSADEGGAP
ncbi:MAG: hypothetical protein DRJ42_07545 [Deltaproteobacteria bacterium]|nr:MAG: hypothetical protein DRJ42_07545 [Deltaproteobacteria bacterium]